MWGCPLAFIFYFKSFQRSVIVNIDGDVIQYYYDNYYYTTLCMHCARRSKYGNMEVTRKQTHRFLCMSTLVRTQCQYVYMHN